MSRKAIVARLWVLFLDKQNQLLLSEKIAEGTVDHAPVYPGEIVRRALELNCSALILVNNHPSGDPTPLGRRHRHDLRGDVRRPGAEHRRP